MVKMANYYSPPSGADPAAQGYGWKIHLNIAPDSNDPLTKEVEKFAKDYGLDAGKGQYKLGHGGDQEGGKGGTFYLGSRKAVEDFSVKLDAHLKSKGLMLPPPGPEVTTGNMPIKGNIFARYDPPTVLDMESHNLFKEKLKARGITGQDAGKFIANDKYEQYGKYGLSPKTKDKQTDFYQNPELAKKGISNAYNDIERVHGEYFTGVPQGQTPQWAEWLKDPSQKAPPWIEHKNGAEQVKSGDHDTTVKLAKPASPAAAKPGPVKQDSSPTSSKAGNAPARALQEYNALVQADKASGKKYTKMDELSVTMTRLALDPQNGKAFVDSKDNFAVMMSDEAYDAAFKKTNDQDAFRGGPGKRSKCYTSYDIGNLRPEQRTELLSSLQATFGDKTKDIAKVSADGKRLIIDGPEFSAWKQNSPEGKYTIRGAAPRGNVFKEHWDKRIETQVTGAGEVAADMRGYQSKIPRVLSPAELDYYTGDRQKTSPPAAHAPQHTQAELQEYEKNAARNTAPQGQDAAKTPVKPVAQKPTAAQHSSDAHTTLEDKAYEAMKRNGKGPAERKDFSLDPNKPKQMQTAQSLVNQQNGSERERLFAGKLETEMKANPAPTKVTPAPTTASQPAKSAPQPVKQVPPAAAKDVQPKDVAPPSKPVAPVPPGSPVPPASAVATPPKFKPKDFSGESKGAPVPPSAAQTPSVDQPAPPAASAAATPPKLVFKPLTPEQLAARGAAPSSPARPVSPAVAVNPPAASTSPSAPNMQGVDTVNIDLVRGAVNGYTPKEPDVRKLFEQKYQEGYAAASPELRAKLDRAGGTTRAAFVETYSTAKQEMADASPAAQGKHVEAKLGEFNNNANNPGAHEKQLQAFESRTAQRAEKHAASLQPGKPPPPPPPKPLAAAVPDKSQTPAVEGPSPPPPHPMPKPPVAASLESTLGTLADGDKLVTMRTNKGNGYGLIVDGNNQGEIAKVEAALKQKGINTDRSRVEINGEVKEILRIKSDSTPSFERLVGEKTKAAIPGQLTTSAPKPVPSMGQQAKPPSKGYDYNITLTPEEMAEVRNSPEIKAAIEAAKAKNGKSPPPKASPELEAARKKAIANYPEWFGGNGEALNAPSSPMQKPPAALPDKSQTPAVEGPSPPPPHPMPNRDNKRYLSGGEGRPGEDFGPKAAAQPGFDNDSERKRPPRRSAPKIEAAPAPSESKPNVPVVTVPPNQKSVGMQIEGGGKVLTMPAAQTEMLAKQGFAVTKGNDGRVSVDLNESNNKALFDKVAGKELKNAVKEARRTSRNQAISVNIARAQFGKDVWDLGTAIAKGDKDAALSATEGVVLNGTTLAAGAAGKDGLAKALGNVALTAGATKTVLTLAEMEANKNAAFNPDKVEDVADAKKKQAEVAGSFVAGVAAGVAISGPAGFAVGPAIGASIAISNKVDDALYGDLKKTFEANLEKKENMKGLASMKLGNTSAPDYEDWKKLVDPKTGKIDWSNQDTLNNYEILLQKEVDKQKAAVKDLSSFAPDWSRGVVGDDIVEQKKAEDKLKIALSAQKETKQQIEELKAVRRVEQKQADDTAKINERLGKDGKPPTVADLTSNPQGILSPDDVKRIREKLDDRELADRFIAQNKNAGAIQLQSDIDMARDKDRVAKSEAGTMLRVGDTESKVSAMGRTRAGALSSPEVDAERKVKLETGSGSLTEAQKARTELEKTGVAADKIKVTSSTRDGKETWSIEMRKVDVEKALSSGQRTDNETVAFKDSGVKIVGAKLAEFPATQAPAVVVKHQEAEKKTDQKAQKPEEKSEKKPSMLAGFKKLMPGSKEVAEDTKKVEPAREQAVVAPAVAKDTTIVATKEGVAQVSNNRAKVDVMRTDNTKGLTQPMSFSGPIVVNGDTAVMQVDTIKFGLETGKTDDVRIAPQKLEIPLVKQGDKYVVKDDIGNAEAVVKEALNQRMVKLAAIAQSMPSTPSDNNASLPALQRGMGMENGIM